MKHTLSPGHLSPARAMRSHVGESAMADASAEHRSANAFGARWASPIIAPMGVAARAPMLGIVGAPVVPSLLASCTVATFVAMPADVYSAAMRLATVAARRGRLCGGRGRRAAWGTATDAGGIVALPVPRDSGDDDEAAVDAIGVVWARAQAGRYGNGPEPMAIGAVYTVARNLGRLRAVRRIRESAPLVGMASDRQTPADADGMTHEQLLALVPPSRRGAAATMLARSAGGESARRRRQRTASEERPASRVALLAQKSDAIDATIP